MNTPSHFLINAALFRWVKRPHASRAAFLWGSVAPDFALGLLTLGTAAWAVLSGLPMGPTMGQAFDHWYFENPWWIASHNFLHSPVALSVYAMVLWRYHNQPSSSGHWWLWFVFGCMVHSTIDILTHVSDGPVILWPVDWHLRFSSAVSYWERDHFGREFSLFERVLDAVLVVGLSASALWRRRQRFFPAARPPVLPPLDGE